MASAQASKMPPKHSMKLAVYQSVGTIGNVPANLALLATVAEQAAAKEVDLIILPELFLTGYNLGDAVQDLAEPASGPSLRLVAQIAQDYRLAILLGYPEGGGGCVYNSAVLIDAAGKQVANYRKIHLYGPEERRLFMPGNEWVIYPISGVKVGILICYDVEFPEAVRTLAHAGAQLIAVPTALTIPNSQSPRALEEAKLLVPARALENQVFVAYSNHAGTEADLTYCGLSCIVGPDGRELARAGAEESLLIVEIDLTAIEQERSVYSFLDDRRPELYHRLVVNKPIDHPLHPM